MKTVRSRILHKGQFALLTLIWMGLWSMGFAQSAYATDFRDGQTIIIDAVEVIDDDLIILGERVELNGTVEGDLFVGGTDITVNGQVAGSIFFLGRSLLVKGLVDGSIYAGGASVTLGPAASVGRNLHFGGFSLMTQSGSHIGHSLHGGGYQILLDGDVAEDATIGAQAFALTGTVGGDVTGRVSDSTESSSAFLGSDFLGTVPTVEPGLRIGEEARVGGAVKIEAIESNSSGNTTALSSIKNSSWRWGEFIALLVVGAIVLTFGPKFLCRTSSRIPEMGTGGFGVGMLIHGAAIIGLLLLIVLTILLAILGSWLSLGSLVGYILGLGLGTFISGLALFLFVTVLLTKVIVAYSGGRLLLERFPFERFAPSVEASSTTRFLALLIGLFIYMLLRSLPFGVGWLIGYVVTVTGLGIIYFTLRGVRQPADVTASSPLKKPSAAAI
ncbi:hypothetical protein KFU94_39070 [Chloroflexi bacterium TSY]|nr:hypothetical protein [Chloroflexi bacterium TSY]